MPGRKKITDKPLNNVYEFDGMKYALPQALIEKQKLSQKDVNLVIKHQILRARIEMAMNALDCKDQKKILHMLNQYWLENEDKLQEAWKFEVDRKKQRWFNVPHCTCPKLDNAERLGSDMFIYSCSCPVHR